MDTLTFLSEGRAVIGVLAGRPTYQILCWVRQLDGMWVIGLPIILCNDTVAQVSDYKDLSLVVFYETFRQLRAAFLMYDDSESAQYRASLLYSTLQSSASSH